MGDVVLLGAVPSWVTDAAAVGTFVLTLAGVFALAVRSVKHVIRDEVPRAMADAIPQVTRQMVRDEVERAVEPAAAGLRADILAELRPNGGSSAYDRLSRRLDAQDERFVTLEVGQAEITDAITRPAAKRTSRKQ